MRGLQILRVSVQSRSGRTLRSIAVQSKLKDACPLFVEMEIGSLSEATVCVLSPAVLNGTPSSPSPSLPPTWCAPPSWPSAVPLSAVGCYGDHYLSQSTRWVVPHPVLLANTAAPTSVLLSTACAGLFWKVSI